MGSRPRRYLFTGHCNGTIQVKTALYEWSRWLVTHLDDVQVGWLEKFKKGDVWNHWYINTSYIYVYIHSYVHGYTCIHTLNTYTYIYNYTCLHLYLHMHSHTYVRIHLYVLQVIHAYIHNIFKIWLVLEKWCENPGKLLHYRCPGFWFGLMVCLVFLQIWDLSTALELSNKTTGIVWNRSSCLMFMF